MIIEQAAKFLLVTDSKTDTYLILNKDVIIKAYIENGKSRILFQKTPQSLEEVEIKEEFKDLIRLLL